MGKFIILKHIIIKPNYAAIQYANQIDFSEGTFTMKVLHNKLSFRNFILYSIAITAILAISYWYKDFMSNQIEKSYFHSA